MTKYKKISLVFIYIAYLISIRILLNITFGDVLSRNIPKDFTGSLIWSLIKILHWCLPIFIYLIFYKRLKSYFKDKYNWKIDLQFLILFWIGWGIVTFAINKFETPELNSYSLIHNVFVTAVVEEFVFRGFVFDELQKIFSPKVSNLLQSIFFSINHLPWLYSIGLFSDPARVAYLLVFYVAFGLVAGYLTKKYKSLIPSTVLHAVNNFLA